MLLIYLFQKNMFLKNSFLKQKQRNQKQQYEMAPKGMFGIVFCLFFFFCETETMKILFGLAIFKNIFHKTCFFRKKKKKDASLVFVLKKYFSKKQNFETKANKQKATIPNGS